MERTQPTAPPHREGDREVADPNTTELVGENEATLDGASIVGHQLIAQYLVDAKSEIRTFSLTGRPTGTIRLPGAIGNVGGFSGHQDRSETFYSFTSFAQPTAIYRYDSATNRTTPFAVPRLALNPADFTVRQVFYTSRDGTRVPMFLVHRRNLDTRAGRADDAETAHAFPTAAEVRVDEESIGGHDDFFASAVRLAEAAIAAPSGTIGAVVRMRVHRQPYRGACPGDLSVAAIAFPFVAAGAEVRVSRNKHRYAQIAGLAISSRAVPTVAILARDRVGGRRCAVACAECGGRRHQQKQRKHARDLHAS